MSKHLTTQKPSATAEKSRYEVLTTSEYVYVNDTKTNQVIESYRHDGSEDQVKAAKASAKSTAQQLNERSWRESQTPDWKVKLISGSAFHHADGSHDVQITVQVNSVSHGNQLDVIRKLAAAPELLEACKALYKELGKVSPALFDEISESAKDKLTNAIAKAEGK